MKRNAGYLFLLITFFCWGNIYIVSKYALAVMGPVTVGMCRYAVSVLCLYGLLKLKGGAKKIQPEHWKYLLILGGLGYFVSIILQLGGTALLSGSLASLITSSARYLAFLSISDLSSLALSTLFSYLSLSSRYLFLSASAS